jgi:hypothetical protein
MLKQSLKASSEGSQTLKLKLILAEDALQDVPEKEAAALKLLSDMKLQLDNVKSDGKGNVSLDGRLDLSGKSIAFAIQADQDLAEIELEGAKTPIVVHLGDLEGEADGAAGTPAADEASTAEIGRKLVDIAGGYAIDNLPNPTQLSVTPAEESVHGETVDGMHIKAGLTGKEMWAWFGSYIDALLKDREGLETMLTALFKVLDSQQGAAVESAGESIFGSLPEDPADDADGVKEAADTIVDSLKQLKDDMAKTEKEDKETLDAIFNDQTYVKADVFVDGKLDIRKSTLEASFKPDFSKIEDEDLAASPVQAILIQSTTEQWNVNGTVTPAAPSNDADALDADVMMSMEGYELLRHFDRNSAIYGVLRDDFHITRQTVMLGEYMSDNVPILTPAGITLVPLRETVEQLNGILSKDKATGTIKVYDDATGTKINVKTGSKQAVVNGKAVKWSFPVMLVQGVTYVPARDLVKALGGKVYWKSFEEDGPVLVIEREP